ncbi:MAG: hypothetical protein EA376_11280, partial [Phycisphaeraceae bacterium]
MATLNKPITRKPIPEGAVRIEGRGGVVYAEWTDGRGGKRREKIVETAKGERIEVEAARWQITFTGADGRTKRRAGFADKAATKDLARRLEDEARKRRAGLIDDAAVKLAEHARRPIAEHVVDFRERLESKGNTNTHVARTIRALEDAIERCEWGTITDIDAARLAARLAAMDSLSPRTRNSRLQAVKSFTAWLVRERRLHADPLSSLRPVRETDGRVIVRRALSAEEVDELLSYVESSGDVVRIPKRYTYKGKIRTGLRNIRIQHRALLYRLMLGSGFRVSETASLRGGDFLLDAAPPVVRVRAGYTKNRRPVEQPIRRDLADALRPLIARTGREAVVWPKLPGNLAPVVKADLRAVRARWILQTTDRAERRRRRESDFLRAVDAEGLRVDAHALRHTFCSTLARSNAPLRVAMELARHSDPKLTMKTYSHVRLIDSAGALEALGQSPILRTLSAHFPDSEGRAKAHNVSHQNTRAGMDDAQNHRKNKTQSSVSHATSDNDAKWRCPDSNRGPEVYESSA